MRGHEWRETDRDEKTQTRRVICQSCGESRDAIAIEYTPSVLGCTPRSAASSAWEPSAGRVKSPRRRVLAAVKSIEEQDEERAERALAGLEREEQAMRPRSREDALDELHAIATGSVISGDLPARVSALRTLIRAEGWEREPEAVNTRNLTPAQIVERARVYLATNAPHMLTEQYRTKGEA